MRFWIWTLCIAPLFAEEESRPDLAEPVRAIRNETFIVASLLHRKTEDGITLPLDNFNRVAGLSKCGSKIS